MWHSRGEGGGDGPGVPEIEGIEQGHGQGAAVTGLPEKVTHEIEGEEGEQSY